ncbi:MAG: hemerythrin domain-containing protein [Rhodocyclaceae bacterium]|nr:hemerythrin domain-containing protein [Rhodocyclaceae bacterium]
MQWTEELALGVGPMDQTHKEFVDCFNALAAAPNETFLAAFDAFIAHTVAHFDQENAWMAAINFPGCHKAEHDRVLAVIVDVRARVEKGDVALGRRLIEELPQWFETHASGMDAALAFHMQTIEFDTTTGVVGNPAALGGVDCSTATTADQA